MTARIIAGLVALVAAGSLASSSRALEIAEVRGDFYYDREGRLVGHREARLPDGLERVPMSHREKFELMGLELPPAPRTLTPRPVVEKPATVPVYEGLSKNLVLFKFRDETPVRLRDGQLTTGGRSVSDVDRILADHPAGELIRAFSADERILDENRETGQILSGKQLADLNNWYMVRFPEGSEEGVALANALLALPDIETAYLQAKGEPPAVCSDASPTTPLWEDEQVYRDAAPDGIDADFAWAYHAGGDGYGSSSWIMDLEWDWCTAHEDFDMDDADVVNGRTSNSTATMNHGTAVVGVYGACDNGYGVTGLTPDVKLKAADFDSESSWAANIGTADSYLLSGEIMLLEIHIPGPPSGETCPCNCSQFEYVPVEWDQASYDAIETATGNGIIVVEAGGNGAMDLDASRYNNVFQRWFRDSGAIIVGATDLNHNPMCFTDHGTRIDVHAFGTAVVTTGYGTRWGQTGCNQDYASSFGGTSSASPIIVGACSSLQGISRLKYGVTLTPAQMRDLIQVGGTPQASNFGDEVSVMPDLADAINALEPDVLPYTPSGWNAPVVPRGTNDATGGSVVLESGPLPGNVSSSYWNWTIRNNPAALTPTLNTPRPLVELDGGGLWQLLNGNLTPGQWAYGLNTGGDFVKGGRHTVRNVADYLGVEEESSENNNVYADQFIWSPLALSPDVPVQRTDDPPATSPGYGFYNAEGFSGSTASRYWHAFAIMPVNSGDDFDVRLNTEAPMNVPEQGFGAHVAWSSDGAGLIDFVVLDRNTVGSGVFYASAINFTGNGAGDKVVEFEDDEGTLSGVGSFGPYSIGIGDLVDVHELYLNSGVQYRVHLDWISGNADVGLALFDGTTGFFRKIDAAELEDRNPGGYDEYLTYTPPASDWYGLVVFKNDSGELNQSITYNIVTSQAPNLVHATPPGWYGPVVPRTTTDAGATFAPLPATLPGNVNGTSFNFSTFNEGPTAPGAATWRTFLHVDDVVLWNGTRNTDLPDGQYAYWLNTSLTIPPYGTVRGGRHHVRIRADADEEVAEFSETDNDYGDWFVWTPLDLVDDGPVVRAAPPKRDPLGFGPYYSTDGLRTTASGNFWLATAVTPDSPTADYDIRVHDPSTGSKDGFGAYHVQSGNIPGRTALALINRNVDGQAAWDFGILNNNADPADYTAETSHAPYHGVIDPGTTTIGPYVIGSGRIVDVHEVRLDPANLGAPLGILMDNVSGNADLGVAIYGPDDAVYSMFGYLRISDSGLAGADEQIAPFTVPSVGYYGIVVWKKDANELPKNAQYRIVLSTGGAVDTPETPAAPTSFALAAPRPNPLRGTTSIGFDVPVAGSPVNVSVYDITGRLVTTLVDGAQPAGRHRITWDGRDDAGREVVSGVYFVRMESPELSRTRKITVLK
jgi:hypothetical protein